MDAVSPSGRGAVRTARDALIQTSLPVFFHTLITDFHSLHSLCRATKKIHDFISGVFFFFFLYSISGSHMSLNQKEKKNEKKNIHMQLICTEYQRFIPDSHIKLLHYTISDKLHIYSIPSTHFLNRFSLFMHHLLLFMTYGETPKASECTILHSIYLTVSLMTQCTGNPCHLHSQSEMWRNNQSSWQSLWIKVSAEVFFKSAKVV